MLTIGDTSIRRVVDLDPFALPVRTLFPDADADGVASVAGAVGPDHIDASAGHVLLGVQSYLIRTARLTILIDSCVGEDKLRPVRPDWDRRTNSGFIERLAAAGCAPEEVDIVLCTHLHADHVGWNARLVSGRWVPTFPNARYLIGRAELAHWGVAAQGRLPEAFNHGAYADSVLPILDAGLADAVDDGHAIDHGLVVTPLPGHTPGQIGVELRAADRTAVFCGDAIHSPVQVLKPDWSSAFCADPSAARATRRALLESASENDVMLIPAHLRVAAAMRVRFAYGSFQPAFCACDGA
jgi:glyoxylase-like metal-dependent hydrolase (beta-lactamase superfamily II)